jgi:hypothetical protein
MLVLCVLGMEHVIRLRMVVVHAIHILLAIIVPHARQITSPIIALHVWISHTLSLFISFYKPAQVLIQNT